MLPDGQTIVSFLKIYRVTLIHRGSGMLSKLFDHVKADFVRNGGIKEQMFRARIACRATH